MPHLFFSSLYSFKIIMNMNIYTEIMYAKLIVYGHIFRHKGSYSWLRVIIFLQLRVKFTRISNPKIQNDIYFFTFVNMKC